jgi:hypothetical protein
MTGSYSLVLKLPIHLVPIQKCAIVRSLVFFPLANNDGRLKWKPPSENSIDFRLELRFPPRADRPTEPDYTAKPLFVLMENHGREGDEAFDLMEVSDSQWEK